MSQRLVSLNEDLSRLRADGFNVSVARSGHILVKDVPYVTPAKQLGWGIIVSELDLAGETTVAPRSHVAYFVGEVPCDANGCALPGMSAHTNAALGEGLTPNHQMSRKPTLGNYKDYYDKLAAYVAIVGSPLQAIGASATARTYPVVIPEEGESVFNYLDTAATKAGLVDANTRLNKGKVAIVGVGGTGSYILDLVAKTPVEEIHIFDGDVFLNHNAFRCPGAASVDELSKKQYKVDYLAGVYGKMRKGVVAHTYPVDDKRAADLDGMSFVFLSVDKGAAKNTIVDRLESRGIPFVDVGMGIQLGDANVVWGTLTVTTSTPTKRDTFRGRVAFGDAAADNEYSRNVQIADLNALNAALAVIKWKKVMGYYEDSSKEHYTAYIIRANHLIVEDCA